MVTSRSLPILFALLLIVGDPRAAHAQTSFKLGAQVNADAGRIDTSGMNWIVGCGSDWWLSEAVGLSYEANLSYGTGNVGGARLQVYSLFSYVSLKARLSSDGLRPYVGGGLGYAPVLRSFNGKTATSGGPSGQVLAGIALGEKVFIEGQVQDDGHRGPRQPEDIHAASAGSCSEPTRPHAGSAAARGPARGLPFDGELLLVRRTGGQPSVRVLGDACGHLVSDASGRERRERFVRASSANAPKGLQHERDQRRVQAQREASSAVTFLLVAESESLATIELVTLL